MRITTFLLLMLISTLSFATLPKDSRVPGGVAIIPLEAATETPPEVRFNKHAVIVVPNKTHDGWLALVGIPLSAKPGKATMTVNGKPLDFTVTSKDYVIQRITIKEKRKVNPNPDDTKRIQKESQEIRDYYATWTEASPPSFTLMPPVDGEMSSSFGLKRIFNGEPRSPHSGLDIAIPEGTPVKASAKGKVIGTGNYFFSGNAVFIDHGQGFITLYCHLSKINVKPGDDVDTQTIIGNAGHTGRATGPHVHWTVLLNGAKVDPRLFL